MASLLVQEGKNVAVVDTDIQSPGINVIFGVDFKENKSTLNDYLKNSVPITECSHKIDHPKLNAGNLYLVPSSINANDIVLILRDGYEVSVLNKGYKSLIEHFNLDYLLIDTHPGLNEETLLSLTLSDELFIILRPDNQDFQGTAVAVEVSKKLDISKINMIVNKVPASYEHDDVKRKVEDSYIFTPI